MRRNKKIDKPYLLNKAVGALERYRKMTEEDAYRFATIVLQAVGIFRPGTHDLSKWGKDLERRMKISRAKRKKK